MDVPQNEASNAVISLIKCYNKDTQRIQQSGSVHRRPNKIMQVIKSFSVCTKLTVDRRVRNFSKHCRIIFHWINQDAIVDLTLTASGLIPPGNTM